MFDPTPEALKDLRDRYNLNQVEVSRLVYVSRRTVQYWEEGNRAIPKAAWELLNIRLGECQPVPLAELLGTPEVPVEPGKKPPQP